MRINEQHEQHRLAQAVQSPDVMCYDECPDREHSHIKWAIVGLPKTNEIVVSATNGTCTYYLARPSRLLAPSMVDRIFGIDVDDRALAGALADELWKEHKDELLGKFNSTE